MNQQSDDLDSFFISENEVETQSTPSISSVDRRAARYLERGKETILGLPGDIVQLVRGMAQGISGITPEDQLNPVQKAGRSFLESLPGSAELRASTAANRPELEPQSSFEEFEDEVIQDFSSLALPVGGRLPFARSLGLSLIGNIGKQGVKELGLDEKSQDTTKLGLMLFSGMFGKGRGVRNHIKNLYKDADQFLPKDATTVFPQKSISNMESLLSKGSLTESKEPALKILTDIKSKIKNGVINVSESIQFDKDINEAIGKAGSDAKKSGYLMQLKKANSNALENYAKENPSWASNWNEAKQAYKGIESSLQAQNFIKRNANLKNLAYAGALLGIEESWIPGDPQTKLGALGATAATLYAGVMAKRLATNPALRRYYANVITASLNENKASLTRNLQGLEREAKKEFQKNPLPVFEDLE